MLIWLTFKGKELKTEAPKKKTAPEATVFITGARTQAKPNEHPTRRKETDHRTRQRVTPAKRKYRSFSLKRCLSVRN